MEEYNPHNSNNRYFHQLEAYPGLGEKLSAYLDAELSAHEMTGVEKHLDDCLRCSAEVVELRQVKRFLSPGSPLAPHVPAELAQRVRYRAYSTTSMSTKAARVIRSDGQQVQVKPGCVVGRRWYTAPAMAGAFLLLLLLVGTMSGLRPSLFAPSPAEAAALASLEDHAMCERLGQIPQSLPGNATQVRAQLASAVGMSVAAPNTVPSGFRFAGGRAFRAANTEAAHLAWTAGTQMISFYQSADPGGDSPTGWRAVRLDGRAFWIGKSNGERAVLWREGGVLYMLTGNLAEADLLGMALSIKVSAEQ